MIVEVAERNKEKEALRCASRQSSRGVFNKIVD